MTALIEAPGGNVTGTSDEVSAEMIMNLAEEITPGFKTIGALYSSGEDNSASVIAGLKKYAASKGYEVVESAVTNSSEVQQAAQYLADKVDVVYSPIDNTVASAMAVATEVFNGQKIPFYVSADSMVADGGLATYGIGKRNGRYGCKGSGRRSTGRYSGRKNERHERVHQSEDC